MTNNALGWMERFAILTGGVVLGVVATLLTIRFDPGREPPPAPTAFLPSVYAPFPRDGVATSDPTPSETPGTTAGLPTVEAMIDRLRTRLETAPDDPEGWRMLGWSYQSLGRYGEAAEAYRAAARLAPQDAEIASSLAEALVRQAGGAVTAEAAAEFRNALAGNPADPRARFFLGQAKSQAGDHAGAIADWLAVVDDAPPGADYVADVSARIVALASEAGIDLGDRLAELSRHSALGTPTATQVAEAESMPATDRQAMIRGMVEGLEARLATQPDDPDGWVRLVRSWSVLGEEARAEEALRRAAEAFAGDAATREAILGQAAGFGIVLR